MWKCERWRLYKTNNAVQQHIRDKFAVRSQILSSWIQKRKVQYSLFDYVQCDIEVPEHLQNKIGNFPAMFENTFVSKNEKRDLSKNSAVEDGLLSQPGKMLISSFPLKNGTLITPLLLSHLDLGLVSTKKYRFVKYIPKKCFNDFVQSSVDASGQRDEKPNSSLAAESKELLANSLYGYQIVDRSRYAVTIHLSDEETNAAIKNKIFKRLGCINEQLNEVENAKSEIEHKKPNIVGLFSLQYTKLRML